MRALATFVLAVVCGGETRGQSASPRTIEVPAPNATLRAELTLARSVRELADGRLLIVDLPEKKVLVADWSTSDVKQVGRNGSGPGEYAQPSLLFALGGDSTLLPDALNGRWLLLHGAAIVATIGFDAPVIVNGAQLPLGADDQGHVLVTKRRAVGTRGFTDIRQRDSVYLLRVVRVNGRIDTVAMLAARPARITIRGPADKPTSVEVSSNPLAAGELAALYPDGSIAIARLEPYRVDWITPTGQRTRGSPLPFERVRLDEREQRAFVQREAARTAGPPRDPASFPEWPDIVPPFVGGSLLPAPDGRLWIRRVPTAASPNASYDVVDRRGALVGRMNAGKDVEVIGFGRGVVFTVVTDDAGIQHLQRRPMPKG
jgi:hypothetical protein